MLKNIEIESGVGKDYMHSEWPWKFLWATVEKEMLCLENEALEKSSL